MRDRPGAYGSSDAEQQEVGLLGEEAVRLWILDCGLDATSIADGEGAGNSRGDIAVRLIRQQRALEVTGILTIEVKTARLNHWSRYERELNATQFERMTCDFIVWCATPTRRPRLYVDLMGWLPRRGLTVVEAPQSPTHRAQVRVQDPLMAMQRLEPSLRKAQTDLQF
jgi:hypothetical protein